MVLPILVQAPMPEPEIGPEPEQVAANDRDALIRYWRRVLWLPIQPIGRQQGRAVALCGMRSGAMTKAESYDLLRDCERLTRLLLRRSWASLPQRDRRWIRSATRVFDPDMPISTVAPVQTNAAAWLFAAMHWCGCRHPEALWCKPLHPPTGVVRWLSGFDVVEQKDHPHDIMTTLAERVGRVEQQSRKLVRAMRARKRVVALLPELLL